MCNQRMEKIVVEFMPSLMMVMEGLEVLDCHIPECYYSLVF